MSTIIKAKFGDTALGDRCGTLASGPQAQFSFERRSERNVQQDMIYHEAGERVRFWDRANSRGEIGLPIVVSAEYHASYDHADYLKAYETLRKAVEVSGNRDLKFTKDNWATTFLTYTKAKYAEMAISEDTIGGIVIEFRFMVTDTA